MSSGLESAESIQFMSQDHDDSQLNSNNQFGLRTFSTDVFIYAGGQGILLLLSFIQGLIVPKFLSVESYGYFQVFRLFASYVGILHLGFIDGALVRWAGKGLAQIDNELKAAFKFLVLELAVIIIPSSLVCYFLLKPPFQEIALIVLAFAFVVDLGYLFIFAAQAARRFKLLTAIHVGRGLVAMILIIVFFVAGKLDYHYVIFALLVSQLLFALALVFWFRRYLGGKTKSPSLWAYGKENISIGIFVLLGNLIIALFFTIDRLMVNSLFSIEQFAIYAFALVVANVAYGFAVAVSRVFFPYLSGAAPELRTRAYQLGKPAIILAWAGTLVVYFPLTWLIQSYLPHYVASLPIMKILLCTVGFGSLVQILHANYYMAYRKQRQYFLCGIVALAVLAISNLLAIKIWGTLESIAIATLMSFGVWYIMNELSLKSIVMQSNISILRTSGVILCFTLAFWTSTMITDLPFLQLMIYVCIASLISYLLLFDDIRELVAIAKGMLNK